MKRKLLALLLSVAMLFSMLLPIGAQTVKAAGDTLYVFDLEAYLGSLGASTKVQYDYLKFATALQGLANRDKPQIYFMFKNTGGQDMDQYWFDKLSEPGEYLADFNSVTETDFWALVNRFKSLTNGLVLWDENVPATANVASTIAGVEGLLPVRYDTAANSLYNELMDNQGYAASDVKKNLVGMFTGTGTIPDSSTPSTGSTKNDAYIWAKEQYLDTGKTNPSLMAYTLDGFTWTPDKGGSAKDGTILSVQIPDQMKVGETVQATVTARNTGTTETWSEAGLYRLGATSDDTCKFRLISTGGETNRIKIRDGATVAPGEEYTFTFAMKAPDVPGDYPMELRFVQDGVAWFGSTFSKTIEVVAADAPPAGTIPAAEAKDAELVSVKIPDEIVKGETAEVSVTVRNAGTEDWTENNTAGYRLGRLADKTDFAFEGTAAADRAQIGATVSSGDKTTFTFTIKAPDTTGSYELGLGFVYEDGADTTWFGDEITRAIEVVDALSDPGTPEAKAAEIISVAGPAALEAGKAGEYVVAVKNTGSDTWTENGAAGSVRVGRCDDSPLFYLYNTNGDKSTHGRGFIDRDETVEPGEIYYYRFYAQAPANNGAQVMNLQMINEGVAWFGPKKAVTINVTGGTDEWSGFSSQQVASTGAGINYPDLMNTALPNCDYYIAKKAFFWDLSPDATIAPIDDRDQPIGTDVATLEKLLRSQAEKAGNSIYTVSGFVPWHLKYTSYADPQSSMAEVASEWRMIDIISTYHGQLDADAMGMVGISNCSVFSKVPQLDEYKQNNDKGASNTLEYDPDTDYILFYMGDYDAGSWTSSMLPRLWDDPDRDGDVPLAWPINSDLINRIPHMYNYMYKTAGENDYFVTGDNGTGYLNPMFLEGSNVPAGMTDFLDVWKNHNIAANRKFDIDITGFLIAGNAGTVTETVQAAYSEMTPRGVVYQGGVLNQIYNDTPFVQYLDIGAQIPLSNAGAIADTIASQLASRKQFHCFRSVLTAPSVIEGIVDKLRENHPDQKFEVVDPYTFMDFFKEAGGEDTGDALPTYEAPKATAAITIDGVANDAEWQDAQELVVSTGDQTVKDVGTVWGDIGGDEDIKAVYKVKWDEEFLYILEDRQDNVHKAPTKDSGAEYDVDATLLMMDLNGVKSGSSWNNGDYSLWYSADSPNGGGPKVVLRGSGTAVPNERTLSGDEYTAAAQIDGSNYVVELKVPWSLFEQSDGEGFKAVAGKKAGFSPLPIDNDNNAAPRQLMWCGNGDDQSKWGNLLLTVATDFTALQDQFDEAEALEQGNYPDGLWNTFVAARAAAKALLDNRDGVSQTEVDDALAELIAAQDALAHYDSLDLTELQELYDELKDVTQDAYADDLWAYFAAARDAAQAMLDNPGTATQAEVDATTDALLEAYLNMVLGSESLRDVLQQLYDEVKDLEQGEYPDELWDFFAEARDLAKDVLDNPNATDEEVAEALLMLALSYGVLMEYVPEPVEPTPVPTVSPVVSPVPTAEPGATEAPGNAPQTGDTNGFLWLAVVMVLAAGAAVTLIVMERKRRRA